MFEDHKLIEKLKKTHHLAESSPPDIPDILHLACHTEEGRKEEREEGGLVSGYNFSDIDEENQDVNATSAAKKICEWAGFLRAGRTSLVFFNACYSAIPCREALEMLQGTQFSGKAPYMIAWEEEAPNSLCNALAASVYQATLVDNWSRDSNQSGINFELLFKMVKDSAMSTCYIATVSDPIRGGMSMPSTPRTYEPVLITPKGQNLKRGRMPSLQKRKNPVASNLNPHNPGGTKKKCTTMNAVNLSTSKEEEHSGDVCMHHQPQCAIKDEPIEKWIEFEFTGKRISDIESWLDDMKLMDVQKTRIKKVLANSEIEEMRDIDAMSDFAQLKKDLANFTDKVFP
jgi:hypothetical protein